MTYEDFTAGPLGTVERVYAHFGLTLTGQAAGAMRALHAASGGPGRPAHRYTLSTFGLTGEQVDARLAGYQGAPA